MRILPLLVLRDADTEEETLVGGSGSSMRLTIIGIGYLGLTHAVCMAELGHDVVALDTDAHKLAQASSGEVPFFEPGLEAMLRKNLDAGRLRFTDLLRRAR